MSIRTEKVTIENLIEIRLPGLRLKRLIAREITNDCPDRTELKAENVERKNEIELYFYNEHYESGIKIFFNPGPGEP